MLIESHCLHYKNIKFCIYIYNSLSWTPLKIPSPLSFKQCRVHERFQAFQGSEELEGVAEVEGFVELNWFAELKRFAELKGFA